MKISANHRCKDTVSAMVKLATEIEESTSGVIDYGMVSHFMPRPHDKLWRAMRLSFLGQLIARCKLMTHVFEEKVGNMKRSVRVTPKQGADRQRPRQRSSSENHLLIR